MKRITISFPTDRIEYIIEIEDPSMLRALDKASLTASLGQVLVKVGMLERNRVVKDFSQSWNVFIDLFPGGTFSSSGADMTHLSPTDQNTSPDSVGYPKKGSVCHGAQSISKVIESEGVPAIMIYSRSVV